MPRISALVLSIALFAFADRAPAAVPDSLQQMYDTAQYKPLLKEISVELAKSPTKGKADTTDRYSLLIMKGEALIHLKAGSSAEDAFNAAALVGPDANAVAVAKATSLLVRRSNSSKYQPKTRADDAKAPPAPIDIIDAAARKEAFAALLIDLLDLIKPQYANLDRTTSLAPIETMARQLGDAQNVEIAATSSDTQTKDMLDKLSKRASDLMTAALKPMDGRITTITRSASQQQRGTGRRTTGNGRTVTSGNNTANYGMTTAGLSMANVTELDNLVSEARQIYDAAGQMIPIFGDNGAFKTIQTDADKIINSANKVLTQYHYPAA